MAKITTSEIEKMMQELMEKDQIKRKIEKEYQKTDHFIDHKEVGCKHKVFRQSRVLAILIVT